MRGEPLSIGTSLGDYELLDQLGAGGMGVAYKAFDSRLKRTVAIKALHPTIADDSDTTRRLLREARAAAVLQHPNVCTIHSIAEANGVPFIVMEYVNGRTLADVISDGPMEPLEVTALAVQVVDALAAAHAQGLVHRDIKPANIMVTHDGQVKVLDFGLASSVTIGGDNLKSLSSIGVGDSFEVPSGTVGYMSPEQIEGLPLDGRSDLFSLGVVLYELCTQRHPFTARTPLGTLARVLSAPVMPISETVAGFPPHLDRIIQRCLAKDKDERYANVQELQTELSRSTTKSLWRRRNVQELPSVAVLPFQTLSGDTAEEYLTDGITSELTTKLAQTGELLVIARTSSMRYRNTQRDVREIGRELGVRTVVEGVARTHGGRCRLTVNLIDVENGFHVWADNFESPVENVFEVAAEIVQRISSALRVQDRDPQRGSSGIAMNQQAFELYLRAVYAYHKFTNADNLVAIEMLKRASECDRTSARAQALLASACLARVERGWEADVSLWLALALEASDHALRLDAHNSEAYSARGLIHFFSKRHAEAEADVREALRVDRNNDIAHDLLGRVRFARGEFVGAISAYRDALTINPYYVWCLNDLAWALMLTGDEVEAARTLDRVLLLSPGDEGGHCGRAVLLHLRGQPIEALAEVSKAQESNPRYPWVLQLLPPLLAAAGKQDAATAYCGVLTVHTASAYFGYAGLGLVHLSTDDTDRANECVAKAMQIEPFYAALDLGYATLYDEAGANDIAAQWVAKAVREGIRLVEVNEWHPALRRLAGEAGIIPTRSNNDEHTGDWRSTRTLSAHAQRDRT